MKKNILIVISLVAGISGLVFSLNPANTSVYINMSSVYEKFNLSKELNKELETVFKARKHILDSLYENLKSSAEIIEQQKQRDPDALSRFKKMEEEYLHKEKTFEDENRTAMESNNEKIWKQINQYTEKYGKEMDYDYILGANGQGNIMYGKDQKNVTEDLVNYINAHYEDKTK